MPIPLAIPAALSLGSTLFKGLAGNKQRKDAQREIDNLEGQEPEIAVPMAYQNLVSEPVAEEYIQIQEDNAARRTGQTVGALKYAGARGIMGGLNKALDSERNQERGRIAGYEQERKQAMGRLASQQADVQRRKMQNYLSKLNAARQAKMAGQQNISSAFSDVSQIGQSIIAGQLQSGEDTNWFGDSGGGQRGANQSTVNLPGKSVPTLGGMNPNVPMQDYLPNRQGTVNLPGRGLPRTFPRMPENTINLPGRGIPTF